MMFRKKVLIVGGDGFIGRNLQLLLSKATVIDKKLGIDFLDVEPYKVNVIVFLAVDMGKTKSAYSYNKKLFGKLDEWLSVYPDTHVIYTSSAAVYGEASKPVSERDLPKPANLYGDAKLLGECYVQQFKKHTILRLSNVFGPWGHGAINRFMRLENKIYGDGKQVRDYVSVFMVVSAILDAIAHPDKWQGITNVSSGRGRTTKDIYKEYGTGKPRFVNARVGDVEYSVLDNRKFESL